MGNFPLPFLLSESQSGFIADSLGQFDGKIKAIPIYPVLIIAPGSVLNSLCKLTYLCVQ